MADEVPEGSGADKWSSGGSRRRWRMKFGKAFAQVVDEVLVGWGGSRRRWRMKFWRIPGQIAEEVPAGPA